MEALIVHSVHTGPYVCLVGILQECSPRVTLLRTDNSNLRRRKLCFFGDARVPLAHPTVLGLVVPKIGSLWVRGLPRVLLALWLLGRVDASGGLMMGIAPARRGLLTLTKVS